VQHAHAQLPDQAAAPESEPAAAQLPVGAAQAVLALQRSAGNRAVGQMLARREVNNPTFGSTPKVSGGDWLDTDRKNNTQRWKDANEHNLLAGAFWEYREIAERRDFYRWFYEESTRKGIEARWALAASIVAAGAGEMAHMSGAMESMGRITGASSNEVQAMMRTGNQVIFDNVFPKLKKLWTTPLTGQAAVDWDAQVLAEEQNMIQPLYSSASKEAQDVIEAIAKGGWQAQAGSYISSADWVKSGHNIKEGYVPYFTGDLLKPEDRWQYGMKLAGQFSTLSPGTVPAGPPPVSADYKSGVELGKVNTRPHVHMLEAMIDADLTNAEHVAAVALLKTFSYEEQRFLISDKTFPARAYASELTAEEMIEGMGTWTYPLVALLRFLDTYPGFDWDDIEYKAIQPMILSASVSSRRAVRGTTWRDVFVEICDDSTIHTAVADLGIAEPEKSQWVAEETSIW
jgi:hypothetical protein